MAAVEHQQNKKSIDNLPEPTESTSNPNRCVLLLPFAICTAIYFAAIFQLDPEYCLRFGSYFEHDLPPKIDYADPDGDPFRSRELSASAQWIPRCKSYLRQKLQRKSIDSGTIRSALSWRNVSDFNLVYIKVEKVGGSTVSGVVRGIAAKLNMSGFQDQQKHWIQTEPGTVRLYL